MPYIGQAPAPKVITSSDLSADVVTEAKIADNAVENEHLNANVITGHTALGATPADTDELLVSDAGTLKRVDFSYLKGGGMWEFISSTNVTSAVAQVDFTTLSNDLNPLSDLKILFTFTMSSLLKQSIGNLLGFQAKPIILISILSLPTLVSIFLFFVLLFFILV